MSTLFKTRVVHIGAIPIGGDYPIRIQSMTNTQTLDTIATVEQSIRLIEAGCEYVRITAQSIKEAENLKNIRNELHKRGYKNPLIADVHFNNKIAELAAQIVEKVRINPGNYSLKPQVSSLKTQEEYQVGLENIRKNILPLINICKEHGTALRIGSNHGSLSERIINRYGDIPLGMVESALEFVRVCRELDFHDIVLSMKASNVKIMVESTRLLVSKMIEEGMDYPLHLGVTEAGEQEDGIIRSAAGIGSLLEDGIGDTIRVSLTGDPVAEIPVAKIIVSRYDKSTMSEVRCQTSDVRHSPFRRETYPVGNIGGNNPVAVIDELPEGINYVKLEVRSQKSEVRSQISDLRLLSSDVIVCETDNSVSVKLIKELFFSLVENKIKSPVIIKRSYKNLTPQRFQIYSAIDMATLLIDGFGDAICLDWKLEAGSWKLETPASPIIRDTAYNILQSTGVRITQAEYISCPTCGRTSYNVEKTLKQIKMKTRHLKGLKIAVMGCIVNGPGEMADADYGYVGTGKGKINLYKGRHLIKKNINEKYAIEELINLIKEAGDWKPEAGTHSML